MTRRIGQKDGTFSAWTVQHRQFYESQVASGILRADWSFVDSGSVDHYQWMAKKYCHFMSSSGEMATIAGSKPAQSQRHNDLPCPIWAWKRFRRNRYAPRPSDKGLLVPGTPGVIIEFCAHRCSSLLSQFEMWTHAMSNRVIKTGFGDVVDNTHNTNHGINTVCGHPTWDRMFKMKHGDDYYWGKASTRIIQIVLERIPCELVVSVVEFVAQ